MILLSSRLLSGILPPPPKCYNCKPNSLSRHALKALEKAILISPYLAESQLATEHFQGSKGFSVVFRRPGIHQLLQHFPQFQPYIDIALKSSCNAFYLNPLVLGCGLDIKPHVDCSISIYSRETLIPKIVSVLYINIPEDMRGGELVLQSDERFLARIVPQTNTLIYFLGALTHCVKPVRTKARRVSLICEQYNLPPKYLKMIPEFGIISGSDPTRSM